MMGAVVVLVVMGGALALSLWLDLAARRRIQRKAREVKPWVDTEKDTCYTPRAAFRTNPQRRARALAPIRIVRLRWWR